MAEDAPGQGRTKQGRLCWKCAACPQMLGQWCLLPGTRYVSSERNHVSYKCKRLQTKGESKRPKKRNFRGYSMTDIDSKRGAVQVLSSRVSENTHSKVHAVKSQRWCIYLVLMEPTPLVGQCSFVLPLLPLSSALMKERRKDNYTLSTTAGFLAWIMWKQRKGKVS